jgi:serine/threonine protein kinase
MAPESLRKNEYSYKSDIWALGVIFYEMLFADTPWRAKNEKDLLRKIEN